MRFYIGMLLIMGAYSLWGRYFFSGSDIEKKGVLINLSFTPIGVVVLCFAFISLYRTRKRALASSVKNSTKSVIPSQFGKSLRFHIIAALALYGIDALLLGQGIMTLLVAVWFLVYGIYNIIVGYSKGQKLIYYFVFKIGVYFLSLFFVGLTINGNKQIAKKRADRIISAIKQYRMKHNRFPDKLTNLVPDFLAEVPIAKFTLMFNEFWYYRHSSNEVTQSGAEGSSIRDEASFCFISTPPFGRRCYNFENDSWSFVD